MSLPEKCTIVHLLGVDKGSESDFAKAIGVALRSEPELRRALVKKIGSWTGASDRAIKNWLAGTSVPSGFHLVTLMRKSDAVLDVVMTASGRKARSVEELVS